MSKEYLVIKEIQLVRQTRTGVRSRVQAVKRLRGKSHAE